MNIKFTLFVLLLPLITFSQVEDILTNIPGPSVLIQHENEIFFSEYNGGRVSKFNPEDPNPTKEIVVTGLNRPFGLAIKGDTLFVAEGDGDRISIKLLSDPTSIYTEFKEVENPNAIGLWGDYLYIAQWSFQRVIRINITETNPIIQIVESGFFQPTGLVI